MSISAILNEVRTITATVAGFSTANTTVDRFAGDPVLTLPFACIYHTGTDREPLTVGKDVTYRCTSIIEIEIQADKGTAATVQANLSALGDAVMAAIEATKTLNGNAFSCYVSGITDQFSSEGESNRGARTIALTVEWLQTRTY